ncbi:MAG: 6-bladed beta-propeller [Christensenellaceae bacterium]|jgi:hypothetical protein|nr:6-bladed beta-propeller [Christensenellaceae bacterium]
MSSIDLSNVSGQIKVDELFDSFEYIPLETTDASIFGAIDKLVVCDEKFFIFDKAKTKKVFVFHNDGAYSHTIGSVGGGEGEYSGNVEDFVIDKEKQQVIILTHRSFIYIYDMAGRFIQRHRLTSETMLWNICSYKDGYVCSTNHQVIASNKSFLIYDFDNNFKLKSKLLSSAQVQAAMPPFTSIPIQNIDNKIIYFDNFTSTVYFNVVNPAMSSAVHFILGAEVPPDAYANPQVFFTNQSNYSFFIDFFFIDSAILWASFIDKGKQCVFAKNFTIDEHVLSHINWMPKFLFYHDGYFYSHMNPLWILEGHDFFSAASTTKYPIDIDSNPVIVRFKMKNGIFKIK